MSVVIEVEFLRGLYEAGSGPDRAPSEWPPHPARLFNALVAVSETDDELNALRWLEAQPAPDLHIPADVVRCGGRVAYVPTNRLVKKKSSYGGFPARKALGPVTWNAYSLKTAVVGFEWLVDAPPDIRDALQGLVGRVPYLGRSTSPVVARLADQPTEGLDRLRPAERDRLGTTLDVASVGYLDGLIEAHEREQRAWEVPRTAVVYAESHPVADATVLRSPYHEMIVLGFGGGKRFAPAHAMVIAGRLRKAIQSHLDGGPLVLRGLPPKHKRESPDIEAPKHQVIVVGLPFVGFEHASGQLMGVAVLFPAQIADEDRRSILRGLRAVVEQGLNLGRLGRLELDPAVHLQRTLHPSRWKDASREWVSALPISANRFHKQPTHDRLEEDLLQSCADLDLPVPELIEVSRGPIAHGATTIEPRLRVRHRGDRATASFHARIRFSEPVEGPIVLGSLRRYGLGLMLPTSKSKAP